MDPHGLPVQLLAAVAGVSLATAQRWKRQHRIPRQAARLIALVLRGELAQIGPAWRGFTLAADRIWTPYGFGVTPNELSAFCYRRAQLCALECALAEPQQWALFVSGRELDRRG